MNLRIAQLPQWTVLARKLLLAAAAFCLPTCSALAQTTATVNINASSVSATVPPEGYGLNTYVYDGNMLASGVAAEVEASGVKALRYPGGSYSDLYTFISGTDFVMDFSDLFYVPSDTFANFMNDLALPSGSVPVITLNYGSNSTGTGPAPVSEAAAWVQYANVTNNYGIVYWEIGNETYGNGYYSGWDWEDDLHDPNQSDVAARVGNPVLSPTAYGTNAAAFVKAMKAVDPNIKACISVNPSTFPVGWDKDVFQGISSALSGSGYTMDCVIEHWYPGGSTAQILAGQSGIPATAAQIRSDIDNYYTLSNKNEIQIIVTETGPDNSGTIDPGNAAFLFALDDYLTWLENGAQNVDYQDLHQGFLEDSSGDATTPYGPWYGATLSSTLARVGDNLVAASSSNSLLRAHAANRTDGKVGIVLINDDPNNSTNVSVNVSGATLSTSGTQYNFGKANFSNGNANANSGISESSIGGVGDNFTVTVPSYSSLAVLIPTESGICNPTAIIPAMNVGGVWTQESSATVTSTTAVVDLGPQPLTGGTWAWTGPNGFTSTAREIDSIKLSTGANVYTANYTNSCGAMSTPQAFTITVTGGSTTLIPNGTYIITAVNSGSAIDDPNSSKTDGEDMQIYTVNNGANQQWTVNNASSNVITLTNVSSGQALDVAGASKSSGALVDQWPGNGQTNHEWNVISLGNGEYELISVNSGLALSVVGGGTANGTGVDQLTYSGSTSQQWKFTSF
jgi:hypothetical protein